MCRWARGLRGAAAAQEAGQREPGAGSAAARRDDLPVALHGEGASLTLTDGSGVERVRLRGSKDEGAMTLFDSQARARVEVSAGATLIETETARIADTKTADTLKSLPMNTRGIWAFLALSPNVLQAAGSSTIRFAGSRSNQSHWAIDGTTMSDGVSERQNHSSASTSPVAENRRTHLAHTPCRGCSSSSASGTRVSVTVGCTS